MLNHLDSNYVTTKPAAFLNWILLDDQFHYVAGTPGFNSGFDQAGTDTTFKTHLINGQVITHSGYLFIYVSNTTPI